MTDISNLSVAELLSLHVKIGEALREKKITRSTNNPTGDLAEYIFCKAFGWEQSTNSVKGYDAVHEGKRYQIKARRLHDKNKSRQLSVLRDLNGHHFDYLAAILFRSDYTIHRAAIIPYEYVLANTRRSNHTNSDLFFLRDAVWEDTSVRDVTQVLRDVIL